MGRWLAVAATLAAGCSRQHYRERADKDVEAVVSQKNIFPDWKVENWHVYPDPRARYSDPIQTNPDFPPYPPDDYAAWLTAPNPQHPGRGGTGRYEGDGWLTALQCWDAQNRAEDEAEAERERREAAGPSGWSKSFDPGKPDEYRKDDPGNPAAAQELSAVAGGAAAYLNTFRTDVKPFRIRLDQSVELAIFNAREFQDRREDLYLAALPVTLERYNFAAQAFAVEQIIRQSTGRDFPGGGGEAWQINTDVGVNRRFATGGELMVRLANQIVVNLSSSKPETSISNLGLTFVQPLLRGGGYAVTLEALTQAERTLLYAIRSFARFRKVFYTVIAGAGNYTNNPYGLQGLAANLGRGVGANLTANPVGYLPTILRAALVANERKNVTALEGFLRLYQNLKEGGQVSELQVNQVEQNLLTSRTTVLNDTRLYLDNLDFFKLQLGVPTTVPLELDDTPLRPVRRQIHRFEELFAQVEELQKAAGRYDPNEPPAAYRARWQRLFTESALVRGTAFAKNIQAEAERLRRLPDDALARDLASLLQRRQRLLDERADRQLKNVAETPQQEAELDAAEAAIDRYRFEQALRRYEARPWLAVPADRRAAEQARVFQTAFELGFLVATQARTERLAAIRETWPPLPPVCVDGTDLLKAPLDDAYTKASQVALVSRLDLMNARAQVVDGWRQVTVQANSLQGVFDVRYDLNTTTPRTEADTFGFAGTRTQHTVTLRIEPPFVRRAERNQYRAALIGYQRSRRNLMAFEDNILADTRQDLRQLRNLAESYAIQQRAVELGYALVDSAQSTLLAPPDPTSTRGAAGDAAALTQQLLQAQSSLLQAQNALYTTWINYQTTRLELFLDLELLPLDARGIWIDEPLLPAHPAGGPPGGNPPVGERLPEPQPVPAPAGK
jgi:hypothetical protein